MNAAAGVVGTAAPPVRCGWWWRSWCRTPSWAGVAMDVRSLPRQVGACAAPPCRGGEPAPPVRCGWWWRSWRCAPSRAGVAMDVRSPPGQVGACAAPPCRGGKPAPPSHDAETSGMLTKPGPRSPTKSPPTCRNTGELGIIPRVLACARVCVVRCDVKASRRPVTLAAPSLVGVAFVLKVAGRDAGHGGALALSELPPVALTRCSSWLVASVPLPKSVAVVVGGACRRSRRRPQAVAAPPTSPRGGAALPSTSGASCRSRECGP